MREWERITKMASFIKEKYPNGTRIMLKRTDDMRVSTGSLGTVIGVDGIGSIKVLWDFGITSNVIADVDEFVVI